MTDPRDPAFIHVSPIAKRFIEEARASIALILGEFDDRTSDILEGMEASHAPWQEELARATKPKPRVIMPRGYVPPNA